MAVEQFKVWRDIHNRKPLSLRTTQFPLVLSVREQTRPEQGNPVFFSPHLTFEEIFATIPKACLTYNMFSPKLRSSPGHGEVRRRLQHTAAHHASPCIPALLLRAPSQPRAAASPPQYHEDTWSQGWSPAAPQGPRCPAAPARRLFCWQQPEGCGLQSTCSSNMTDLARAVPQTSKACRMLPGLAPATEGARQKLRAWLAQQESQLAAVTADKRQAWCVLAAL